MRRLILALLMLLTLPVSAADFKSHVIALPIGHGSSQFSLANSFTLDHADDQLEWIVQCSAATTITTLLPRYGVRTGTPPELIASIQGVGTDGNPDGTIKGGASPASVAFTPPADVTWNGTIRRLTLANTYACARGEWIAIVIAYSSGTIDGSNSSSFNDVITASPNSTAPYAIQNNAGARTRGVLTPLVGWASATNTYGVPVETVSVTQFSSDSTPDEYALKFTFDAAYGSTFQVNCVLVSIRTPAASKSILISLYEGTTALQTVTWDGDFVPTAASANRPNLTVCFDEATLATLNFGTTYYLGFAPQETSANFAITVMDMDAAGDLTAFPGGTDFYLSTRSDAGAWSDTTTSRPVVGMIITGWTEPTGRRRIIGG